MSKIRLTVTKEYKANRIRRHLKLANLEKFLLNPTTNSSLIIPCIFSQAEDKIRARANSYQREFTNFYHLVITLNTISKSKTYYFLADEEGAKHLIRETDPYTEEIDEKTGKEFAEMQGTQFHYTSFNQRIESSQISICALRRLLSPSNYFSQS